MDEHYEVRRNIGKEQIEFRQKTPALPETGLPPFNALRIKDLNTFYVNAHIQGICCTQTDLKAVVDSDYAKPFNPFVHYFTSRKAWDGKTDFIGQLTRTVKAADQAFFEDSFRRWLVGMVACAINDEVQNHQLMLFHGAQGKGKSTFIRHLLPPELKDYYRNGMINPDNNNHLLQMSSCLIINLDEFDTLSPERMQSLKSLITQDVVNERKVYDIQNYTYIRRASFIASTNNPHCLPDIGENRRILFNTLLDIDYHTPVNHEGIYAQAYGVPPKRSDRGESFLLFPGCQAERHTGAMVSCRLPAVDIEYERTHAVQLADEKNAGHNTGKQPFPFTEDFQQRDRILGGGVYASGAHGKFNSTATSGSEGIGVVIFLQNNPFFQLTHGLLLEIGTDGRGIG